MTEKRETITTMPEKVLRSNIKIFKEKFYPTFSFDAKRMALFTIKSWESELLRRGLKLNK